MKHTVTWFYFFCKRNVKQPAFLLLLLLIPAFCFGFTQINRQASADQLVVGLCAEGDFSHAIADTLLAQSDGKLTFRLLPDQETLTQQVTRGEVQCGFVLSADLFTQLQTGSSRRSITQIVTPDSLLGDYIYEIVFSAVFEKYSVQAALDEMHQNEAFAGLTATDDAEFRQLYEAYLQSTAVFHFDFEQLSVEGDLDELQAADLPVMPVAGVLGVLLFLMGMVAAAGYQQDLAAGLYGTCSPRFRKHCGFLSIAAPLLLLSLSSLFGLLISGLLTQPLHQFAGLLVYDLLVTGVSLLLARCIRSTVVLVSLIPMLSIAALVCCPIFVNLSAMIPVMKLLEKCMVPYYYLAATSYAGSWIWITATAGMVCCLVAEALPEA